MSGWTEFTLALLAFLASHMIPARPRVRAALVGALGLRPYILGYSLLSVLILIWLVSATAQAPYVQVLPPHAALRWAPALLMALACPLIVAGMSMRNPFSFGGLGRGSFDPEHPGILALSRHPLLLALLFWSLAHLLANGDLAHVILFGGFAAFSVAGMALIDRRKRRMMGAEWDWLARNTARFSVCGLSALLHPHALMGGAALYLLFFAVHGTVIGLSPVP
ncbi:NnrU family protein [Ruegeria hyattellae]|uniref:NnrU family protein n=1 Tax=Ruegeria hyattellae TaxID=3233337 RepID=UPI00355B92E5